MKNTALFIFVFSFLVATSQTLEEQKEITKNYNLEALDEFETRLITENEEINEEINTFLKKNKTVKKIIKSGNKKYYIAKIIDGKPIYITTDNVNSAKATRTNFLHNGEG